MLFSKNLIFNARAHPFKMSSNTQTSSKHLLGTLATFYTQFQE